MHAADLKPLPLQRMDARPAIEMARGIDTLGLGKKDKTIRESALRPCRSQRPVSPLPESGHQKGKRQVRRCTGSGAFVGEVRRDGSLKTKSGRRSNLRCAAAPAS
jgi:hypothetical protein